MAASSEADVEALAAAVADWSGRERGGYLISLQRRTTPQGNLSGAFVSQRALEGSENDFAVAIRRAAQESPDILLVTGADSEQSLHSAVLSAASGRLVIVGLVATSTVDALRRLAGFHPDTRHALAAAFRGAIGYRSLRRLGGGRTLVRDVIFASNSVCDLLKHGDFERLRQTQRAGLPGMRSVDESLARAVTRRQIGLRDAASHAVDRGHLVALVRRARRARVSLLPNAAHDTVRADHDLGAVGAVSSM